MVGLCDCNNFFVSCQRLFQPDLDGRPVAVLSGNDGCVIARSNEVKALGIKMGVPLFQVRKIVEQHDVKLFSANHRLYSDISQRVMATLRQLTPAIEIYSVDEAFIDFSHFDISTLKERGEALSRRVRQNTGIPVSIGIAPTKTLAKIASKLCKEYPKLNGCCVMHRAEDIEKVLKKLPIEDVWGIGRNSAKKLHTAGVQTAYQFSQMPKSWVHKELHITGLRIWRELRGEVAHPFDITIEASQSISIGRSFSKDIASYEELQSIVAQFASSVANKLRAQGSCVTNITTYLNTNRHRSDLPQHFDSDVHRFDTPTDFTLEIAAAATSSLRKIYKDGYGYKKAGVICSGLMPKAQVQCSLFDSQNRTKHNRLMSAMDKINAHFGNKSVQLATEQRFVIDSSRQHLSPSYTTTWSDLPKVKFE